MAQTANRFNRGLLLLALAAFFITQTVNSAALIEPFIKHPRYQEARLSPDGSKLAVVVVEEGKRVLALMSLDPLEFTYVLRFRDQEQVGDFYWANNERVLVSLLQSFGWFDDPLSSGRMYAIDYNGRSGKDVFGYLSREGAYAHASVVDTLVDDRKHVLINTFPWSNVAGRYEPRFDTYGEVLKLNVYSGKTKKMMSHPARGAQVSADANGKVHFATSVDDAGEPRLHRWTGEDWRPVEIASQRGVSPIGYSDDGKYAYLASDAGADTIGLLKFDLDTGDWQTLYREEAVDMTAVSQYPDSSEPAVLYFEDGLPREHFLDPEHPYSRFYRGINKAFEGRRVTIESSSRDGKLLIVRVSAANLPGDYYLANAESKALSFLFSSADWLDPATLAKTEVIELQARDGLPLQGYLTFPAGPREKLPLVVLPHGGPTARDYWDYNAEAQMLAANGYLVLRINFRGSQGYGAKFQFAADRHWGTAVQDDITDAVQWTIDKDYADKDRIVIYGASFGGYSAMMSAIRKPELYRCAAGYAGVYDLQLLYEEGDIPRTARGTAYLNKAVGGSETELAKQSPVQRASEIKIPLFIAHGGEDYRAPIEHAEALIAAAKDNNLRVVTHINKGGGHGFYTEDANRALYTDLLSFLDACLKP